MATADDLEWVDAQATVHIFDWQVNEQRPVNVRDPEIKGLIAAGLLVVVDEETRKLLPPPVTPTPGNRGCSCGQS